MSKTDKETLLKAIDIIDSLSCWSEEAFRERFEKKKSEARKDAMITIREILDRN